MLDHKMKKMRKILRIAAIIYLASWCLSAIVVYPGRLIRAIDSGRENTVTHPTILSRSISFAPTLLWLNWQEGDRAFDCAGYQGIVFATPFGTKLLWKRMTWIS